jgi:hypothetical protein
MGLAALLMFEILLSFAICNLQQMSAPKKLFYGPLHR